ncbi:hypothetical protein CN514_14160 [Bacillus sp. AFS001701]|uniref:hypothetical protein n=1 Tax=Bacillus sp. AFS001701 TaxID=2033480 RepID=UPI000BF4CB43|nr:hypothetical protein [Bacillus sp. AFS001701]PET60665.1 hypothetical protein CN514_14160 [Bacillus sp. AFS001701]
MNLFGLIVICTIGGFFLTLFTIANPVLGGGVCFGIILGCLLKGLFLLREIRDNISSSPSESNTIKKHKVKEAYESYLKEKNINKIVEKYSIKNNKN